ncbi:MAG: amino acid adenylation domain-containing protein [bacterium]|nr:amino acid adenylation domain-containing protein [bacterium]
MTENYYSDKLKITANQNLVEKEYWLKQLHGIETGCGFRADIPTRQETAPPSAHHRTTAGLNFRVPPHLYDALMKLRNKNDVRLNMVLLAGVTALLYKYGDSAELVPAMPIYKQHETIDFLNTMLPIRSLPAAGMCFKDLLLQIRQTISDAITHQNYPMKVLADQLNLSLTGPHFPVSNLMVLLENIHQRSYVSEINTGITFTFLRKDGDAGEGGSIEAGLEYCTSCYSTGAAERIKGHFLRLMEQLTADVNRPLEDVALLTDEEKKQVLEVFNNRAADTGTRSRSLHGPFREQAARTPDNIAVFGAALAPVNGTGPNAGHPGSEARLTSLSYRRLDAVTDALAARLISAGVGTDDIVGLLLPPCIEMVVAILGVLKSGGAYMPMDTDYPAQRIDFMLKDSGARVLITSRTIPAEGFSGKRIFIEDLRQFPLTSPANVQPQDPASAVYVIYTSGNTGRPKGVLVEHGNATAYLAAFLGEFEIGETDTSIQLTSFAFDAFVEELYPVLRAGGAIGIPRPDTAADIRMLADFIKRHGVTMMDCTPLLLNEFNRLGPFPHLRIIISGGDVLKEKYVDKLLESCRVHNTYGPTESTVCAAYFTYTGTLPDFASGVPIGKPISGYGVYILDGAFHFMPVGIAGEICVAGPGITRGYLNRPELTAEKFVTPPRHKADPNQYWNFFSPDEAGGKARLYKTGDRGRWLPDGNIEFLGRLDLQVKIRGYRIETGEIETQLSAHLAVNETVVVARTDKSGDTYLCAYLVPAADVETVEASASFDTTPIKMYLLERLPAYMMPSYFVPLSGIPLTPSGKLDRRALPDPQMMTSSRSLNAPTNELQEKLAAVWAGVLELDTDAIDIFTDFFDMGGHSLKAVSLVNAVHKDLNVKLNIPAVYKAPTIASMAQLIQGLETDFFQEIKPLPPRDFYQLSYAQKRIRLLHQLNPDSAAFNMAGTAYLDEAADESLVRRVTGLLIRRHEAFRTRFSEEGDSVVQVIEPPTAEAGETGFLEISDLTAYEHDEQQRQLEQLLESESTRPFALDSYPLFRLRLIKISKGGDILFFNMHHIISDGWSLDILRRDFTVLYSAVLEETDAALPVLRVQYKDYADWHNRLLENSAGTTQALSFWKEYLSGELPLLDLPYNSNDDKTADKSSAGYRLVLSGEVTEKLRAVASNHNASLFMVLLSGLNLLLSSLRGQKDLVIGIPGAARQHEDLKNIIGLFINTLILKNRIESGESFDDFLDRVRESTLNVLEYQGYPMEMVCEALKIKYPDLKVFFNMVNIGSGELHDIPDLAAGHVEAAQDTKFDLTLYIYEYRNGIEITCNYFSSLFQPATVEGIMGIFKRILENIAADASKPVEQYHKSGKKRKLKRG